MKKLLALLLFFIGIQTFSQKQANIWYFGQGAGVDFNFSIYDKKNYRIIILSKINIFIFLPSQQ